MRLLRFAVLPLRAALALLFVVLVLLQTFSLPGQFRHLAEESPDLSHLRWPLLALSVAVLLCVQVVIVCTWKLLGMVVEDRIFSAASLAWVDGIVAAVGAAWVLLAGLYVYVGLNADDPGPVVLLTVVLLGGAVLGLLLVVLRALLLQATTLRTDMESVI